jgi:hypothetical protein
MANTANYGWHYPVLGDAPNVPSDIQSLAVSADSSLLAEQTARISGDATAKPTCIALITGTLFIPTVTNTQVTWASTERNDSVAGSPMWASGSPLVITVRQTGLYNVGCRINYDPNVPGDHTLYLIKNYTGAPISPGTNVLGYTDLPQLNVGSFGGSASESHTVAQLTALDQLTVVFYTGNGSGLTLHGNTGSGACRFWASYQGA